MLRTTKFILIALITMASTLTMNAQKYGHINLGDLLTALPATKSADTEITNFQAQLMKDGEAKVDAFQKDYQAFQVAAQNGTKSQVELQTWQAQLQKKQEEIQKFSTDSEQKIVAKRQALLEPILTKIQKAIDAVAKENGYLMIFDVSTGAMMYAKDSDDVTALVKAKM